MGSGDQMEMNKIEDSEERQVAFSKRRNGIFKKAHELSLLCDAEVSVIIYSEAKKLHEYTTPTSTMKKIIDEYQRTVGIDLWSSHYEKMQEELTRLKDINSTVRRDIMQRMGEELNDLNWEQLCSLEQNMLQSLDNIRHRKYRVMGNLTDVYKKKVRNLEDMQAHLRYDLEVKNEFPHGLVVNKGDSGSTFALANEIFDFSTMQHHRNHQNLHVDGSSELEDSCIDTVSMEVENSV